MINFSLKVLLTLCKQTHIMLLKNTFIVNTFLRFDEFEMKHNNYDTL